MKKGVYRRSVTVEVLKDRSNYKKGTVVEVHPVLAKRLIAEGSASESKKEVTATPILPTAKIKS